MEEMVHQLTEDNQSIHYILEVCEEPTLRADLDELRDLFSTSKSWLARRDGARRAHLQLLKDHHVYDEEIPPLGERVMTHRWVDQDNYDVAKSRFTCRGFEQVLYGDEEFFAATPRECSLRTLLIMAEKLGLCIAVADAAQAFLQAPLREDHPVWVKPPEEAGTAPGIAWRLRKTLPGLKGGPAAWGDYCTEVLKTRYEFVATKHEPCLYYCKTKQIYALRHMDDFMFAGHKNELVPLLLDMAETLLLRDIEYLDEIGKQVRFLGREIARRLGGYDLAVSRKLAEEIVNDAGCLGRRTVGTTGHKEARRDETPVNSYDHSYYRTQVGRLIFYCQYRPDMQFATGQCARHVGAPMRWNMVALKRVIRYLAATMDMVLELRPEPGDIEVDGYSDSDWAGLEDRKSVSCGAVRICGALAGSYSKTQASRALSSCEAELYGLGSVAVELLWLSGLLLELFAVRTVPVAWGDSSSALSLASRSGMGRLKHVELRMLALQEWIKEKRLTLAKVSSEENLADIGTKFLAPARISKLVSALGVRYPAGRGP